MNKKTTGERLEFYNFSDVTVEHLHRYAIANDFVKNKIVLDIASGEGYGSYILSKNALEVIGVDIDKETVFDAQKKYLNDNLTFKIGSADNIPVDSDSIDIVVSFETIEHHDKHEGMLLEIKRILKPDGILIMSSPDKKYYSDLTGQKNPFHVKELYFDEFKNLVNSHFCFANFSFQSSFNLSSFIGKIDTFYNHKIYSGDENNVKSNSIPPVYNIVIASDKKYYNIENSFFNGNEISNRVIKNLEVNLLRTVKKSTTFRVGSLVVYPFFIIKKTFKRIFV